jgi:hypothetical protein
MVCLRSLPGGSVGQVLLRSSHMRYIFHLGHIRHPVVVTLGLSALSVLTAHSFTVYRSLHHTVTVGKLRKYCSICTAYLQSASNWTTFGHNWLARAVINRISNVQY